MKKNRDNLPIINLNLGKEFTKDSNKLLRELLQFFIKETPGIQQEINKAFDLKQAHKLNDLLHKLNGSSVYCGLDRLKESLIRMKKSVNKRHYVKEELDSFNKEIENALKEAKKFKADSAT